MRRPQQTPENPLSFTRQIATRVPVLDLKTWTTAESKLLELLAWLTGDHWDVSFAALSLSRHHQPSLVQDPSPVVLFSGGLDSLLGSILLLAQGLGMATLSVSTNPRVTSIQNRGWRAPRQAFGARLKGLHRVTLHRSESPEPSQRTRGLLYLGLGGAIASVVGGTGAHHLRKRHWRDQPSNARRAAWSYDEPSSPRGRWLGTFIHLDGRTWVASPARATPSPATTVRASGARRAFTRSWPCRTMGTTRPFQRQRPKGLARERGTPWKGRPEESRPVSAPGTHGRQWWQSPLISATSMMRLYPRTSKGNWSPFTDAMRLSGSPSPMPCVAAPERGAPSGRIRNSGRRSESPGATSSGGP